MIYILAGLALAVLLLLAWLTIDQGLLLPVRKGLSILMYHKVSESHEDPLTTSLAKLGKHFQYLKDKGYSTFFFREIDQLLKQGDKIPRKSVILTFDDAYEDFYTRVVPLLEKFRFRATVFVPVAYIGKTNVWDRGSDSIMNADELKEVSRNPLVEVGIHSFLHHGYEQMTLDDMSEDLRNCFETLDFHHISFTRVLAYPYGSYPRKEKDLLRDMKQLFRNEGLAFAIRIGNRVNAWPLKEPYELTRTDIRGTDNFYTFKTKLRKGRKKLFA